MTWLVIGGNGQLGTALSVALNERRIKYFAWGSEDLDIRLSQQAMLKISLLAPSVIVNAAAWTDVDGAESDPDGAYAVNTVGALNLVLAAKSLAAIYAHISTDYVFSGVSDRPWQENDLLSPVSIYGKTKAAGELAVLNEYAERSYIFRTAWLYSQWGKNFAKTLVRLALYSDDEVQVVNDQIGQPTSARDLANQIIDSVLAKIPFGIYHATNSGDASWFEFAQEIFQLAGADVSRVIPVSALEYPSPAKRPAFSVLSHEDWSKASIATMREWKIALSEAMPSIISSIKAE